MWAHYSKELDSQSTLGPHLRKFLSGCYCHSGIGSLVIEERANLSDTQNFGLHPHERKMTHSQLMQPKFCGNSLYTVFVLGDTQSS